jgi:hypothetical protein
MNHNLTWNSRIWIVWTWKIYLSNLNHKWCIGGKLLDFNYKCNLTFRNTLAFLSFTGSICNFKYNHLLEPRVEGQEVASHSLDSSTIRPIRKIFANLGVHKGWTNSNNCQWWKHYHWLNIKLQSNSMSMLRERWM